MRPSGEPTPTIPRGVPMKITRVLAVAALTGILSLTAAVAPAQARLDTSWGYVAGGGR